MSDSLPSSESSLSHLNGAIARLKDKLTLAAKAVEEARQDRSRLEAKITDAQSRIQHILSRLPEQSDTRQLNLLAADEPNPTISGDDHEPTTH
jgi:predicted  nucleic acid-binding Zn-ribbon protein